MEKISKIIENKDLIDLKNTPPNKHGGKRPGAGMPKGTKTDNTIFKNLVKEKVKQKLEQRVLGSMQSLLNAQFSLARGEQLLYRVPVIKVETKGGGFKLEKQKPELVTDQNEIERFLAGEYDNNKDYSYYYITTKQPENKAIDSLLDRVFGRAPQTVTMDGNFEATVGIEAELKHLVLLIKQQTNGNDKQVADKSANKRVSSKTI